MLDSIFLSLQIKTIMLVNSGRQLCQCHSKNIRTIFSNHRVRRNIGLKSSFMPLFYFSQDILIFFSQLNIFFSPGMQSFDQLLSPNRFTVFVSGIHFFFFSCCHTVLPTVLLVGHFRSYTSWNLC